MRYLVRVLMMCVVVVSFVFMVLAVSACDDSGEHDEYVDCAGGCVDPPGPDGLELSAYRALKIRRDGNVYDRHTEPAQGGFVWTGFRCAVSLQ